MVSTKAATGSPPGWRRARTTISSMSRGRGSRRHSTDERSSPVSRRACRGRYPSRCTRRSQAPDGRSSRRKAPAESLRAERTAPEAARRVSKAPATGSPASPSRSRPSRTPASRGGGWVSCRASSRDHKGMKKPALVRERVGAPCPGTSDHLSAEGVVHLGRRQVSWLPVCAFRLLPDPRGISGCCRGRDGGVAVYRSQWRDRGRFSLPSLFFRCPGRAADTCAVMSAGSVGTGGRFVKGLSIFRPSRMRFPV